MKLHFRQVGTGRPILILHGLFGSGDNWLAIAKSLSENGHSVILPDARNHGRSPHSEIWDLPAMADDAAELLESLGVENAVCLGHSMGGKVAMNLAFRHPEKIQALIVADVAPKPYLMEERFRTILTALKKIPVVSLQNRSDADGILAASIPEKSLRDFLLKNLSVDESGTGYRWKINLSVIDQNLENIGKGPDQAARYDGPVLMLYGTASDYVLPEDHGAIQTHFPKARFFGIPGAGHWLHAEEPQVFTGEVLKFLREIF